MSTTDIYLEPHEIAEFIRETKISPQFFYGYEDQELGICPFLTFYIYHDRQSSEQFLEVADKVVTVFEEFKSLIDEPFLLEWKGKTQVWLKPGDKRLPTDQRLEARARLAEDRPFWLESTDQSSTTASARWAFSGKVQEMPTSNYTTVKITFRNKWYQAHQDQWHSLVSKWVRLLQPEQCYSGYEVGNTDFGVMGSYESDVLERICADYFYGMDIDHPSDMGFHYHDHPRGYPNPVRLGSGLRTPTWCFILSPYWLNKLGKTEVQVRAELDDPRIVIEAIPFPVNKHNPEGINGLWIRLGALDLHCVENGLPPLLVKANRLIRPVRCNELRLLSLDPWDDDPNPRFDFDTGPQWMARFDEDSNWPTPAMRAGKPPEPPLFAMTGESCPRSGLWSPRADVPIPDGFVSEGEPMPTADWRDTQGQFHQQAIKWQWVKASE